MSNKNEEKTEQKVDNHQNDESCKCEEKNNPKQPQASIG